MVRGRDSEDFQDVPRPLVAFAKDYADGHQVTPHAHARGQVMYATSGVLRVFTEEGSWILPPFRALWIPPGVRHSGIAKGPVEMRTLYIEPGAAPMPGECRVIEVPALLRELILSATEEPADYDEQGRAGLIVQLLLQEVARAPEVPLRMPLPREPRLARVCRALLERPGGHQSFEWWAKQAGASSRTLARLFQEELGMSFAAWRQQVILTEALVLLATGRSVKEVAAELGYRSPSAFTAMFSRSLGGTPERYMKRGEA